MKRLILLILFASSLISADVLAQRESKPKQPVKKQAQKEEIKITESDDPEFNAALDEFKEAARDEYMKDDQKIVENKKPLKKDKGEKAHLTQGIWGSLKWTGPALILTLGIGFAVFMNRKKKRIVKKKRRNSASRKTSVK